MESVEKKMKHLEMIENVIERMGNNSFQLKGWAVTLVALVGAFAAQGTDKRFFLLAFVPLLAFWFLDSFYLQMERKYKILYNNVAKKSEADIDFNMDTRDIIIEGAEADRICFCSCLFANTEWPFYLIIAGVVGVLALILILT